MTPDTIFRIYSMSKPVTSVATMQLIERGRMGLDEPVSKYLPELAELKVLVESKQDDGEKQVDEIPANRPITVRDLLRHTSGFTYGITFDSVECFCTKANSMASVYSRRNQFVR